MSLAGNSYQAEILRHIHEQYGGHLQDTDIGVTRRLWNELGQRAGCHLASVAAALSTLETHGRLVTEFGLRSQGGRCRISVLVIEEPPAGITVWKGRVVHKPAEDLVADTTHQPTAEEIATWLLKKTVEAAQVPVLDIIAAQHHAECLNEDLNAWQELASEYEERIIFLQSELEDARLRPVVVVDNLSDLQADAVDQAVVDAKLEQLERELRQVTRWRDDARRDAANLRQLLHDARDRITVLETENATLEGRLGSSMEEEEARQLRQRLYGMERSLEESRRANDKAERKITKQAQEIQDAMFALAEANAAMRTARQDMTAYAGSLEAVELQVEVLRTQLHDRTEQLRWSTEYIAELIVPDTTYCRDEGVRQTVRAAALSLHTFYDFQRQHGRGPTQDEIAEVVQRHMQEVPEEMRVNIVTEKGRVSLVEAHIEEEQK